jgi:spore coat polysaccharide biosynthesis protein SpsF
MKKKLIAALACRLDGTRMFGKPLQRLDIEEDTKIIDNIVNCLKKFKFIKDIVLGISEGEINRFFITYAKSKNIKFIIGDKEDVLSRLIKCAKKTNASDILRTTSESPFVYFDILKNPFLLKKKKNTTLQLLATLSMELNLKLLQQKL